MKKISLALICTSVFLFGCHDFKKSIQETLINKDSLSTELGNDDITPGNTKKLNDDIIPEEEIPFTSQKDKLEEAEKQLRALPQFAGQSIFIYKLIHFYDDGRIITKLQNPKNPQYIDAYQYENGQWQDPKPVVMHKNEEIQNNLINLDRLPFVNVYHVYEVLSEKRKEIGSNSDDYTIYAFTQKNRVEWYPMNIENERSTFHIEYQQDGTLKSFEQE